MLNNALCEMRTLLTDLHLEFNEKTQIFPISHGAEYLGWRFGLTETGAVTRRLKKRSKIRWKHRLRKLRIIKNARAAIAALFINMSRTLSIGKVGPGPGFLGQALSLSQPSCGDLGVSFRRSFFAV